MTSSSRATLLISCYWVIHVALLIENVGSFSFPTSRCSSPSFKGLPPAVTTAINRRITISTNTPSSRLAASLAVDVETNGRIGSSTTLENESYEELYSSTTSSTTRPNNKNNNSHQDDVLSKGEEKEIIKKDDNKNMGVPTLNEMFLLVMTTVIIWLSEPLLSLVDMTVVGQNAATVLELAALGPATLLVDNCIFATYFLCIATTNTVARAMAKKQYKKLLQLSSHVLGLATCLGGIITLFLCGGGGRAFLQTTTSSSTAVTNLALQYCQIRALVSPLAIMGLVAENVLLACMDTITPALAVGLASIINIIGDVVLVRGYKMGVTGAAWATAAANVVSWFILMQGIQRQTKKWKTKLKQQQKQDVNMANAVSTVVNGKPILTETTRKEEEEISKSLHNNKVKISSTKNNKKKIRRRRDLDDVPLLSLPDRKSLWDLLKMSGPIFFVMMSKIMAYNQVTLKAARHGVVALAANAILVRIFSFCSVFGDATTLASQTFCPQVMSSSSSNNNKASLLVRRLSWLSLGMGILSSSLAIMALQFGRHLLTRESSILNLLKWQPSFLVGLGLLLHPFVMSLEGALLAQRDFRFLMVTYTTGLLLLTAQMHYWTTGLSGIWLAFVCFQGFRINRMVRRVSKTFFSRKKQQPMT